MLLRRGLLRYVWRPGLQLHLVINLLVFIVNVLLLPSLAILLDDIPGVLAGDQDVLLLLKVVVPAGLPVLAHALLLQTFLGTTGIDLNVVIFVVLLARLFVALLRPFALVIQ